MAELIESLREKWDGFLDWSEDKGLPLKGIALALEDRGIPSLPAFLVLVVAIGALAFMFLAPMLAPPTSKAFLYAKSVDGTAVLSGVTVALHSEDGKVSKEGTTDADGLVLFDGLPAGKYYADYSSETYVFDDARVEFETKAGKQAEMTNAGAALMSSRLQLYFTVDGPDNADVYLFAADGTTQLDHKYGFADGFDVESEKEYVIKASADGYSPVERPVRVGTTNTEAVTLKLRKLGSEGKGAVRVGVFTSEGLDGAPIANASVEIKDATTGATLFTLTSGESGDCESQQVVLGTEIAVFAAAPGFLAAVVGANVSDETNVKVRLDKALASNAGELGVRVRDANGNAMVGASVSIYSQDVVFRGAELAKYAGITGLDGSVVINVSKNERLAASAFKPGYLPAFVDNVAPGADVSLTLVTATPYNSGTIGIVATDKSGSPVAGAVIALLGNRSAPLGIPAKITATDGTQTFESVPAGAVAAVAAWGGRIAFTDAVELGAGDAAALPISFPPAGGRALFSVTDYFSGKPLDGVTIAIGNATCETKAGSCAIEALETEATTATAVAAGYEKLETAPFAILPNAEARVQLAMLNARVVGEANLVFVGVFDLAGNRMKTLKPSTTYEARYVIRAPTGLEFTQAEAHVRLGEVQGSETPAEITAWKAFGGFASSGSSYEAAAEFEPAAAGTETGKNVVTLNEFEAFPADSEFTAGADGRATVYFKNAGTETRRIAIEGLLDSGVTIETGAEFSYTFVKTGIYKFKDLDNAEIAGTVAVRAAEAKAAEASVASATEEGGIKWVNFVFDAFTASREIAVQFRTAQATSGKVALYHRSAFKTQATVLRQPVDADAGVTKSTLLANAAPSGAFDIAFGGECGEGVCVEWDFNGDMNFEAPLGKEFKLNFRVFGQPNQALTVRLRTSAVALKLKNAVASGGGYSPASEKDGVQENAVNVKCGADGTVGGSFVMESRRLASDAELDLDVLAGKASEPAFSKQLFLRVISETAPSLKVEFAPKSVVALASTKMKFTVKDQYGVAVSGAHVVIGNEKPELIAGNAIEAVETDKAGEYAVEGIEPQGIGAIDYVVEAEGFKTAKGEFAALPPAKMLEITPAKLQGNVDSSAAATISFTVANKVSNDVQVRAVALSRGTPPQFTDLFPAPVSFTLKGGDTADAELIAGLNNRVLLVSDKPQTLGESVEGVLRITARIGRVTQNIDVPFAIKTSFKQEALDDAWEASATELSFDLDAETEKAQTQLLTVTNNAPYPLLINQENTMAGGFVQPLSAIIAPGASADFAVTSSVAQEAARSCFIEEGTKEGTLSLYASFQGITSKKTVSLSSAVTSTAACAPEGGFSLGLPADVRLSLPAGTKQKQNSDGSVTVKLPADDSLILFATGASLTASEAQVPMNIPMVVPPQWVSSLGNGAWRLVLPMQAQISIPSDTTPQSQSDSSVLLILGGAQLVLPAGTPISLNPSGERVATLPAGTPIVFQTIPFTSLLEMLSANSVEVQLPVETTLIMPPGTIEVKQPDSISSVATSQGLNYANRQLSAFGYNPKVVKLPDGSTLGFTQEATSKTDASGLLQVTIPADAPFLVPGEFVGFVSQQPVVLEDGTRLDFADKEGAFVLMLPMPALFYYGGDDATLTRDSATKKYLLKVGSDAAMEFDVEPTQTARTGTSRKALAIPASSPITVLYGGAAREIENPADVTACPETFKSEQATIMDFPAGTHVSRDGANLVLTPLECNDAAKITVTTKEGQELYTSPAAFKVLVAGGQISKGAEGDESAKTVNVPAKALITFKVCAKGDNELKRATLTVPGQADITLPAMSTWKGDNEVTLGGVKKISITVGSKQMEISKTDKITFESSKPDEKILKNPERTDRVTLSPWSKISYVPYCEKASTGKLSVKVERNVLEAADMDRDPLAYDWTEISEKGKQPIDIEIYDDKATVKVNGKAEDYALSSDMRHREIAALAQICVENRGVTTIKFEQPAIGAVKGSSDLLREALPTDVDHMHFLASEEAGKQLINIAPKPDIPCHTFQIETVIPDAAMDADLCIKEDYVIEGYLVLTGVGEKGVALERRIPLRYTLKPGNCANKNKDKAIKEFDSVAAAYSKDEISIDDENYKQMSFKQAGHWRYLSLLNNRDEDVTLTVVGQGATMDCNLKKAPDDDALEPLQTGTVITAGEAAVYKCVGKSSGDYVVTFTGERSGKTLDKNGKQLVFTKQIIVKVWDPVLAAYAGIYTDTPLGSVYVSEAYMAVEYPEQAAEEEGTAPTEETPVEEKSSSAHEAGATTASLAEEEEEEAPTELGKVEGYAPEMYHICRNYFCTYTESEAAFRTFLQLTLYSLDDKTKNEVSLNRLCAQLPAGKQSYQRSSVIQMTNTLSELGEKKRDLMTLVTGGVTKASEIAVGAGFDGGVVLDPQTNNQELRGCGVYVATAVADLKCANRGASVEEWRKDIVLQVFVRKIAECPVNVANAALLTAEEPEELVGKERIGVFGKFDTSGVEGIFDVIGKGVYKFSVYSESSDSHNAETAKILHSALYGENFKGEWVKQGSVPIYENADFCIGESGKRIAAEAGSVATLLFATAAALQVAQAAGTLGTSLLVSAPGIIEALAKATTICGMDLPREGLEAALITHEFSSCDIANDCAYAVIMAGFDVLFTSLPGGKGAMAMRAVGRRIATDTAYTAMGTVGVLGVEGIITGNEIKESVPYAYGGGRAFRGIRFASAAPVAGNRLFNRKMLMLYGLDAARSGRIAGLAAHLGPNLMKTTKQTVMPLLLDGADNINALPDADPFFTKIGVSKADLLKNGITKSDDLYAFINNGLGYDAAKYGALKTTTAGTLNDDLFKEFLGEIKGYNVETTALADLVNNEIKPLSSQLESLTTALGVQQAAKQTKQVTAQIAQINQQMAPLKEKIKELGELSGGVRTGSGITGALSTTQRSTLEKIFSTSSGDDILKRGALTKQAFDELSDVVAKGGRGTLTGRELLQLSDDARLKGLGSGRLKTINYAMENADGIKVKAGADIPKKSGWRFLKKVGPALAAIVATILFHVETKPVRAELDGQKISHYVVSTTEPSELWNDNPTIYAYCQKAGDEQTCPDGTDVKLQTVCSEEATGCVKIAKANSLSNVQGYTLFVTMNDEALRQEEKGVLSSLFEPNEPPFSPKEKAAEAFGKFETGVIEK